MNSLKTTILLTALCLPALALAWDGDATGYDYEYHEYHEYREYHGDNQQPQYYETTPLAEPNLADPCCGQNQQRYQFVPPIGEPAPGSNQPLYQDVPYQAYPQQQRQGYPFYERYERERWHCFKQR